MELHAFLFFTLFQEITRHLYITFDSGKNVPLKIIHLTFVSEVCALYNVYGEFRCTACMLVIFLYSFDEYTNKMILKWHRN